MFRDIFNNAYLPYRDPETLRAFLKIIDEFTYDHSQRLGDAFEYLLSVLGSQGDAGQFRTPRHIIDFIVTIIDPKKGEAVLDPAWWYHRARIALPPIETQQAVIAEIEAEQALVAANRALLERFEEKIRSAVARVWGEDKSASS